MTDKQKWKKVEISLCGMELKEGKTTTITLSKSQIKEFKDHMSKDLEDLE
ncbi:hypothetical protein [Aquimarina algiphila]|nr:hypothetical protein [Aquimarina algiphila]